MPSGAPQYLNVDLDIESREPLSSLVDALPHLTVMHYGRTRGKYVLSLEPAWPRRPLDQTLRRLAKMISKLRRKPQQNWQRASKRSFNIGFACGSRGGGVAFPIMSETVAAITALDGMIEVTLYPCEQPKRPVKRRSA